MSPSAGTPRDRVAVWISGASSGIGAALAGPVPFPGTRLFGISRPPPGAGEHVRADLTQPAVWPAVAAHFEEMLSRRHAGEAISLHMSGIGTPAGLVTDAGPEVYTAAVLLNSASGQVLGTAFPTACRRSDTPATLGGQDHAGHLALRRRQSGPPVLGGGGRHRGRGLGQGVLAGALRRRPDWDAWPGERSGEVKPAPKRLGNRDHKAHAKASGSYVLAH
jgi:hypothetical protein